MYNFGRAPVRDMFEKNQPNKWNGFRERREPPFGHQVEDRLSFETRLSFESVSQTRDA